MGQYDSACKYKCSDVAGSEFAEYLSCRQCKIKATITEQIREKIALGNYIKKCEEEKAQLHHIEMANYEFRKLLLRNSDPLPGEVR